LLKGYAFFVRRALEVAFVGLRVGPIWNISTGKWTRNGWGYRDKGTIPCCNPDLWEGLANNRYEIMLPNIACGICRRKSGERPRGQCVSGMHVTHSNNACYPTPLEP
jgi:hypothetical protein